MDDSVKVESLRKAARKLLNYQELFDHKSNKDKSRVLFPSWDDEELIVLISLAVTTLAHCAQDEELLNAFDAIPQFTLLMADCIMLGAWLRSLEEEAPNGPAN